MNDLWFGTSPNPLISFGKAMEAAKKVLSLDGQNPDAHILMGYIFVMRKEHEKAIEEYKKSIKREPNNIFSYIGLAGTYSLMGREKEAHEAALELLKRNPEFSLKNYAKTLPMKNQDKKERFIEALRKAGLK